MEAKDWLNAALIVGGGLVSILWAICLLYVDTLRRKISGIDERLEEHAEMINSTKQRQEQHRLEAAEKYVSKSELKEMKETIKEISGDVKSLLRMSRHGGLN